MPAFIDRTDRQYGRLTVIGLSERKTNNGRKLWLCKCECGNICEVRGSDLTTGRVLSCGCFRKESVRQRVAKHGKSKNNRLYQTWQNMKRRCNDPSNTEYHCYGGKGVKVCDDWNSSYESFEKWAVESGYCEPLTIDRIDSNGDYTPDNCQWQIVRRIGLRGYGLGAVLASLRDVWRRAGHVPLDAADRTTQAPAQTNGNQD